MTADKADAPESLGGLVRRLRVALESAGKADAALEARLIVEHATGASRLDLLTSPLRPISPAEVSAALSMLHRRLAGEPVHRIFGFRDFHGMTLALSPGTLEPRGDTEALVELALPLVRAAADLCGTCRILDLGTGTGAVALALLAEEPRATAIGTDISTDALATATRNADMTDNGARFGALESPWFGAVSGRFHVIVSNPPYIATEVIATLDREVREHDPFAALDGGSDGLDAYRAIASGAQAHLEPGGAVAVEIGFDQQAAVTGLFEAAGFVPAGLMRDLGQHVRALAFRDPDR